MPVTALPHPLDQAANPSAAEQKRQHARGGQQQRRRLRDGREAEHRPVVVGPAENGRAVESRADLDQIASGLAPSFGPPVKECSTS